MMYERHVDLNVSSLYSFAVVFLTSRANVCNVYQKCRCMTYDKRIVPIVVEVVYRNVLRELLCETRTFMTKSSDVVIWDKDM